MFSISEKSKTPDTGKLKCFLLTTIIIKLLLDVEAESYEYES